MAGLGAVLKMPLPPHAHEVASLSPGHRAKMSTTLMPFPYTTPRSETLPSSSGQRRSSFAPFRSGTRWHCCRSSRLRGQRPRSECAAASCCVGLTFVGPRPSSASAMPPCPRGVLSLQGHTSPEEPGAWQRLEEGRGSAPPPPPSSPLLLPQVPCSQEG